MTPALLYNFTREDFVDRYSGSALGTAWAFIHPLAMILIYTLIFSKMMGARLADDASGYGYSYSLYLVSGLLPWIAFSGTVIRSATVFADKKPIIAKVPVSLPHLPLYIVLSETLTYVIAMGLFGFFLVLTGAEFRANLLLLPFIFAVQQVLAFGLGLICGVLNVFLRDVRELVTVVMNFWFWLTPIVWVVQVAPESVQALQGQINPAYFFIGSYQRLFLGGEPPALDNLILLVLIAHAVLLLAYLLAKSLEKDVRDFL